MTDLVHIRTPIAEIFGELATRGDVRKNDRLVCGRLGRQLRISRKSATALFANDIEPRNADHNKQTTQR